MQILFVRHHCSLHILQVCLPFCFQFGLLYVLLSTSSLAPLSTLHVVLPSIRLVMSAAFHPAVASPLPLDPSLFSLLCLLFCFKLDLLFSSAFSFASSSDFNFVSFPAFSFAFRSAFSLASCSAFNFISCSAVSFACCSTRNFVSRSAFSELYLVIDACIRIMAV